uniref:DUF4164 domain-containing protein n=1 Tax=Pararhizobium sp. IMCC3301 TaxID=3067904 RepID=UPI0027404164|nr:DUF4164 domain-containing protein [Pararhizobium sp. IMCC3301]
MAQRPFSKPLAASPASAVSNSSRKQMPASQVPASQAASAELDLNGSLERLTDSVQHLRKAVEYRLKLDENQGDLRAEFNRMNDERKRLAARLDQAEGKAQSVQQATKDVSRRLAKAMETIRMVLENQAN